MKKIDFIHPSSKKIHITYCVVLGIFCALLLSLFGWALYPFDFQKFISIGNWIQILSFPFFVTLSFLIHEGIHILFYKLFHQDAQICIKHEKHYRAIIILQSNPNILYTRNQIIILLLSPLILISLISMLLIKISFFPYISYGVLIANVLGSFIDLYLAALLLVKYPKSVSINFDPKENGMNIFSKD